MLPVLIGSRALYEYGLVDSYADIDLVVDKQTAGLLSLECDKKENLMLWFNGSKVDLHPTWLTPSNELIFNKCNQSAKFVRLIDLGDNSSRDPSFKCSIIELPMCKVLLPPLELLYVIVKSHIHRIIPATPFQSQNIDCWYKHMQVYKNLRDKLGYKKMDAVLYKSYLGAWKKYSEGDSIEDLMRQIYQMRFSETIARVGDTVINLEKSEKDFFDDNVERFVEHDSIHSEVGLMFRNNPDPIFKKYQSDPSNVSLDLNIFLKADNAERITMMQEEIMVLLLERKWIPEIIKCYKDMKIPYTNYNTAAKKLELREIGANFVTNLCGKGDYWLRRYCLDHVHLLLDPELYDYDKLRDLTLKITNYESKMETIVETDIFGVINAYANENLPYLTYFCALIRANLSNKSDQTFCYFGKECSATIKYIDISTIHRWYIHSNEMPKNIPTKTLIFGKNTNKGLLLLEKYFDDSINIGFDIESNCFTIYNLIKNIGICYDSGQIKIFTINFNKHTTDSGKKTFQVQGSYAGIMGGETVNFSDAYIKKYKYVYYHSTDCTEQGPSEEDVKFLASYGSAPDFLKPFLELVASTALGISYDYDEDFNKICDNLSEEDSYSESEHKFR